MSTTMDPDAAGRTSRLRLTMGILLAAALLVPACAGGLAGAEPDRDAPIAAPSSTTAPATTAPPSTAPATTASPTTTAPPTTAPTSVEVDPAGAQPAVAASIDDLLLHWGAQNRLLAAQQGGGWERIDINPEEVQVGDALGASKPFAASTDIGFLFGGGIDANTGEVTSILLAYQPDGTALGTTAAFTTIGVTADTADPSFDEVFAAFEEVATDANVDSAFATSGGLGYLIESFESGDGDVIIQLSIHLTEDAEAAQAAVSGLQIAVGDVVNR